MTPPVERYVFFNGLARIVSGIAKHKLAKSGTRLSQQNCEQIANHMGRFVDTSDEIEPFHDDYLEVAMKFIWDETPEGKSELEIFLNLIYPNETWKMKFSPDFTSYTLNNQEIS